MNLKARCRWSQSTYCSIYANIEYIYCIVCSTVYTLEIYTVEYRLICRLGVVKAVAPVGSWILRARAVAALVDIVGQSCGSPQYATAELWNPLGSWILWARAVAAGLWPAICHRRAVASRWLVDIAARAVASVDIAGQSCCGTEL